MAAHALLRGAHLYDAQDKYFWVDPFSPEGRTVAAQMRPLLSEVRLHAEKAIQLTAEARAAARAEHRTLENPEALDALELGARRIDFMGLKFQAADDCIALYSQAQALSADKSRWSEVEELMETIAGNNGRIADLRDGYTQLRGLYEKAWLVDNRPYWLQNNLAHYDAAAQLWVVRGDRWRQAQEGWWNTHTLPTAAELGLPVAEPLAH
jgi:hypothetical protein